MQLKLKYYITTLIFSSTYIFAGSWTGTTTLDSVGVGTTSPNDGKLVVEQNTSSSWSAQFYQKGVGLGVQIKHDSGTAANHALAVYDENDTVDFTVLNSGKVGVGTGSPNYMFDVQDNSGSWVARIQQKWCRAWFSDQTCCKQSWEPCLWSL